MAATNLLGGGRQIALKYGSGFIRKAFLLVVTLFILETFSDAYP
jgi:hypothetical protein